MEYDFYTVRIYRARLKSGRYGALLMRDQFIALGFDPTRVMAETSSNSSKSNIIAATRIFEKRGTSEATLISSPIHLSRLRYLISKLPLEIEYNFATYTFDTCNPEISWLSIYHQIHHEFTAILLGTILPDRCYVWLIDVYRS